MNTKAVSWILRIGVAGEFFGHGMFALQGKEGWFKYFEAFGFTNPETMKMMLTLVGVMDMLMVILVLFKPIRIALLWMAFWGLWTALVRWPFGPDPIWDFVERWANWAGPLALLYMAGGLKAKNWFKTYGSSQM